MAWDPTIRMRNGPQAKNEPNVVYFIRCGDFIKIGVASSMQRRLAQLQIGNPYDLVLLGTVPGGFDEEQNFHALFYEDRHRGEWFRLSQQIVDELRRLGIEVDDVGR